MSKPAQITAMMQEQPFTEGADAAQAPDWIHLLPAGEIKTGDCRGPYRALNANEIIKASFSDTDRLPIDENHATDLAAPLGLPSPACGWIVEMQSRDDGIWGRVEWTNAGRELVSGKAYRAISPVILHDKNKIVHRILRASLVNRPNFRGLAALNQESDMTLAERLAELFGLEAGSDETAIFDAIKALKEKKEETDGDAPALQSQLTQIGAALGVDGDFSAILGAAKQKASGNEMVTALQSELAELTKQLNALQETGARSKAEAFIDGEIKKGRVGVKGLRDHYISMHMEDPERVEKEIGNLPIVAGTTITTPTPSPDGGISLNAEQAAVAAQLGMSHADYAAALKADAQQEAF